MAYMLIGGQPAGEYDGFVVKTLEVLRGYHIKGLAIAAVTQDKGKEVVTGYWGMSMSDKVLAAGHMQADAIDQMILTNRERYFEGTEEDDEDGE